MKVQEVTNKQGKPMYLLIDDDNRVVKEVHKYILHLARSGKSKNTFKNACYDLKLYYDWLSLNKLSYLDVVSQDVKSAAEYLSEFIMWLKYPDYSSNVIPFSKDGITAKRTNNTINQKMSTIYGFYDYLSVFENTPELQVYRLMRQKMPNHSIISEMVRAKEIRSPILKLKPEKRQIKYITRKEFWEIYKACTCQRDRVICGLLFDGALRVSEVIGLHIEDMKEIYDNKIYVNKREDTGNKDAAVKYDSTGYVIIPDYLKKEIAQYLCEISDVDTNYFVFNLYGETKHQPMRRNNIEEMIANTAKRAGLEKHVTPHMFRHGAAVELADMIAKYSSDPKSEYYGLQMVNIKDKLRHSNMESTKVYAEFTEAGREAMALVHNKAVDEDYTENGIDELVNAIIGGRKE